MPKGSLVRGAPFSFSAPEGINKNTNQNTEMAIVKQNKSARSDKPVKYGNLNPDDPSVLRKHIFKCAHPECTDKPAMNLMGIQVHVKRMHAGDGSRILRTDGHPVPERLLSLEPGKWGKPGDANCKTGSRKSHKVAAARKAPTKAARQNVERHHAPAATLNFCPCCGTGLQAFHAAADIMSNG